MKSIDHDVLARELVSPDASPASTWNRGNVFKHLVHAGWNTNVPEIDDLEAAMRYLKIEMERVRTRDKFLAKKHNTAEQQEDLYTQSVQAFRQLRDNTPTAEEILSRPQRDDTWTRSEPVPVNGGMAPSYAPMPVPKPLSTFQRYMQGPSDDSTRFLPAPTMLGTPPDVTQSLKTNEQWMVERDRANQRAADLESMEQSADEDRVIAQKEEWFKSLRQDPDVTVTNLENQE